MTARPALVLALLLLLLTAVLPSPASAASAPHPLFLDSEPLRITIRGPLATIRRQAERSTDAHDAVLTLEGPSPETHAIRLSARGLNRRLRDTCTFPPLRVEFVEPPTAQSLFRGQRRLKLVSHCRAPEAFQQYVLLEFAAYRLLNVLTPLSLRVRLATIDYLEPDARAPFASRLAFFIEDVDDAARRNGLVEIDIAGIPAARLDPVHAARFAVFQYMIGNVDWGMLAGPPGDLCCHNAKLLGADAAARTGLIPVPYDFDHSGFVDAPYATPPPQVPIASVRVRRYRGLCIHNRQAQAAAAEARAARPELIAVLAAVPQLSDANRRRATAYLERFFAEVETADGVSSNLLRTCLR